MAITGVSSSSLLTGLLQNGKTVTSSTLQTATTKAIDSSPAYLLSLGEQNKAALQGYDRLGKLVKQADASLAAIDRDNPAVIATIGGGKPLAESHSIDVQQLARAQILTTGDYVNANQSVSATGTLTIQTGGYDSLSHTFMPIGDPVTVSITDGSLAGVAAAINGAETGVTASVVEGVDGKYSLQLTGQTGAANAFQLDGLVDLAYDPASSLNGLQAVQSAADALYAVDGGAVRRSPSNTGVSVTSAITATLTATGTMTVSVPFGFSQASRAAQTLVSSVNTLLAGLAGASGTQGQATDGTDPASQLADIVDQVLREGAPGKGQFSSLADIGITVQSDGTLAVDQGTLQSAYASDPAATRALLDTAADAIHQVLSGTNGADDAIQNRIQDLLTSMMAQMPSLTDILLAQAGTGSSQQTNDFFGMSGQTDPLLMALQGNPDLAAALGQSEEGQSLLSSLGIDLPVTTTSE